MASTSCIYYVASADISNKGAGFSLYKIVWANTPVSAQSVLVQYREQGDVTWINVSTNLQVDVFGNIEEGELVLLTPALTGIYYEIRFVNQCGSLEYIQTFLYSNKLNAGSYLLDNGIYNICGNEPVTLFSDIPFGVGAKMYIDQGLTIVQTGYNFIASQGTGIIYAMNFATGIVGSDSTYGCNGTITILAKLAASGAGTCSASISTLYSDEFPAIGAILYTDVALSVPLTGSTFGLIINQNLIYTIDTLTGELLTITGTTCTANGYLYQYAPVLNDVLSSGGLQLFTPGSFGKGSIMYTDYAMTTELIGQNFISENNSSPIYTISSTTGEVGCIAVEC